MKQGKHTVALRRLLAALILLTLALSFFTACSNTQGTDKGGAAAVTREITEGGSLTIPLSELSESIVFYTFHVDGLEMEVLAAKDSDGQIRMAFNTCQICNGSRQAYFVKSGDYVVCQNCKNRFGISQVGILSGGCNPYPIFAGDRTETEDSVQLSYEFLISNRSLFTKWKNN